jgi:geranylgeranyl pyrophosphate synthase
LVTLNEFQALYAPKIQAEIQQVLLKFEIPEFQAALGHLLGRGKLFRPLLVLAAYHAVSGRSPAAYVPLATALELIHTFTLIHDDLPCMDDAQLRRGVPAVHVAHGEALALLAGDALLNMALLMLAEGGPRLAGAVRVRLIQSATFATHCVVEGQVLDLRGEGADVDVADLEYLHRAKTGALIGACCEFGGILARLQPEVIHMLHELGESIGLAFQMRDDLLSVVGDEQIVGKTLSTDAEKQKATYPRIVGVERSEEMLAELTRYNLAMIEQMELPAPELLIAIAASAGKRTH